jgi:CRP/FNR family cyclic AMP-dependent transcriptional regulator
MTLPAFNMTNDTGEYTPQLHQTTMNWNSPFEILNFKENQIVFSEGDTPKGLYFIKSGCLKLVSKRPLIRGRSASPEFITKIAGTGELFGYKALIKGSNYNFTAKTISAAEVYMFSKDSVSSIMNGPNNLLKILLSQAVQDIEANETVSQLHYLASVQERIAFQLLTLSEKFGLSTPRGVRLNLKLTRNELAQLAGTINESLSRHLTEFKNEGIIELEGKEIIIKDRNALMAKVK